jgi:ribonuclease J
MYRWIRPEILVPVHGEMRHIAEQARFGIEQGIKGAVVQVNGEIVRLAPGKPAKLGHAPAGRLVLDGDVILPADGGTINERRKLGLYGQMSVAVALKANGKLAGTPDVRIQGVPVEEDREPFLDEAREAAAKAVSATRSGGDREKLREEVRLATRRVAVRWTGKKPVVDVMLIEV